MRKLLLLLVAIFLVGCSTAPTRNASTINVVGVGATEEIARQNGFKQAIQLYAGSVIVTEKESQSYKLIKDDILDYSAGYVDYYKVLNTVKTNNQYRLEMEVRVASSKIAERILKANIQPNNIKGEQLAATYNTYLNHTKKSSLVLGQVLQSYPKYAYNIELGEMELKLNGDRVALLVIPYTVEWNKPFLDALYEVLSYSQESAVLSWNEQAPSVVTMHMYTGTKQLKFLDGYKAGILNQTLGNFPVMKLTFFDASNVKMHSVCSSIDRMYYFYSYNRAWGTLDNYPVLRSPKVSGSVELAVKQNEIPVLAKVSRVVPEPMLEDDCLKSVQNKQR